MSTDLIYRSATELAALIRAREVSSRELTDAYIDRIEAHDAAINAVVVRRFDAARAEADAADAALARGDEAGPLHGIPMTIKESYVLADTPSTWGIESQRANVSPSDGLSVRRFRAAGAHFLGKTNVPKDLADFQSYNAIYGTTNNPWDTGRTPGGSSGGSAAALAAGFSALEAGSDIGGSIRTPAAFCGVFGHKPTWGIVPLAGHELFPGVPDADVSVCGPLARSAADLHTALDIMAGPVEREALGWQLKLAPAGIDSLRGLRVALWPTDELAPVAREIEARVLAIGEKLEAEGAIVSTTARPDVDVRKAHIVYASLMQATMASAAPAEELAHWQRVADELGPEDDSSLAVNARAAVMSHRDWLRHNFRRAKLQRAWDAFFDDWDVLICPQQIAPAFPHDQRPWSERTLDVDGEARDYGSGIFWSGLANGASLPSTAFPAGTTDSGLPIGLQATCRSYFDHRAIRCAGLISDLCGGFTPPPALAGAGT